MKKKRNYGGREPLDEDDRKSEVLKVRLKKDEIEYLKNFHNKSYYKNLSDLVRKILFKETIRVHVENVELSNLLNTLREISNSCDKFNRSKRQETFDYKTTMEEIKKEITAIKDKVSSFEKGELYLTDLRDIEESQKKDNWYFRYYSY